MIIRTGDILTEVSLNVNEMAFKVDEEDQGFIFEILRSKIYKNAIGAICREISSNSRDANRETLRGHVPIKIIIHDDMSFGGYSSMHIEFSDDGPGISPDRMTNVFCRYAKSTKRDDNTQTGGFGLGAKTPFAYTDMFTIITRCEGVKYTYSAYIDESRRGKIALISSEQVPDEENGTSILVPMRPSDRRQFETETVYYTQLWDVRPEIVNFRYSEYADNTIIKEVDMDGVRTLHLKNYGKESSHLMLIDGIPFPIDMEQVPGFKGLNRYTYDDNRCIAFCVGAGEMDIAVNRESLQYTEDAIKTIRDFVERYGEIMKADLIKYINEASSYFHACCRGLVVINTEAVYLQRFNETITMLGDMHEAIQWQNAAYPNSMSYKTLLYNGRPLRRDYAWKQLKISRVCLSDNGNVSYSKPIDIQIKHFATKLPVYMMDLVSRSRARTMVMLESHGPFWLIAPRAAVTVRSQFVSDAEYADSMAARDIEIGADIASLLDLQPPVRSYSAFVMPKTVPTADKIDKSKISEVCAMRFVPKNMSIVYSFDKRRLQCAPKLGIVERNSDGSYESVSHKYIAIQVTKLVSWRVPLTDDIVKAAMFCSMNPEFTLVLHLERNKKRFAECLSPADVAGEIDLSAVKNCMNYNYIEEILDVADNENLDSLRVDKINAAIKTLKRYKRLLWNKYRTMRGMLAYMKTDEAQTILKGYAVSVDDKLLRVAASLSDAMKRYPLLQYMSVRYADSNKQAMIKDYIEAMDLMLAEKEKQQVINQQTQII